MRTRLVEPLRVGRVSAVLVAVLAAAVALGGVGDVTSVLVGGAFMLADFHLIRILVSRLIKPGAGPGLAFAGLGLKFLLVLALVVAVFRQWPSKDGQSVMAPALAAPEPPPDPLPHRR